MHSGSEPAPRAGSSRPFICLALLAVGDPVLPDRNAAISR